MFKSKIKKGLVALITGTMVLGSMVIPASAADSYTATGIFSDSNWTWATWGKVAHTGDATITGDGTYTVTINVDDLEADGAVKDMTGSTSVDAMVFCIDIPEFAKALEDAGLTCDNCSKDVGAGKYKCKDTSLDPDVTISDVAVAVDGSDLTVDQDKVLYGDIEDAGTFRIELANQYGGTLADGTADDAAIDTSKVTASEKIEVTFTISGTGMGDSSDDSEDAECTDAAESTDEATSTASATATATATATAAADSTPSTGDVSLVVVYGALIVCAAGLVLVNLRKKASK